MDRLEQLKQECDLQEQRNNDMLKEIAYQEERLFDLKVRVVVAEELARFARDDALRSAGIPIKK